MQNFLKNKAIIIIGIVFLFIIIIVILAIVQFGKSYRSGLNNISDNFQQDNLQLTKKKPIKKITFKNLNDSGCVEITPEGIVRVYSDCNKDLSDAARLSDPKNILKLIKLVSETDWEKYKNKGLGNYYEIVIETEDGDETIYIPIDDGGEIIKIVDDVRKDVPGESPLPSIVLASNIPNSSASPLSLPSGWGGFASPIPSSSDNIIQQPFICPFTEQGGQKKPINVSNIICSSDPSPAP